ncbi:MAG TPA: hypothetical protein VEA61_02940 [Allosphingosinicella sp.]|nr:hypothetical protein [Allosphingosinicella sp.]
MIYLGLIHGLDNAAVALALAPLLGWRRGLLLAALFAIAEMLMPLLGLALAWPLSEPAAAMLRTSALAVLASAFAGLLLARRDPVSMIASTRSLAALAAVLGLDNLVAGTGSAGLAAAFATGAVSAVLAALACGLGVLIARGRPARLAAACSAGGLAALAGAGALG